MRSGQTSPPAPLSAVEGRCDDINDILEAAAFPTFGLSYLGRNVRRLKENFAAIYQPFFREQPLPRGNGGRHRKRIGILVTRGHERMFLQSIRGVIEQLDGRRFQPVILCSRAVADMIRAGIRRDDLPIVGFRDKLGDAVWTVREAACDLIYYWEVGSDALNYFLPFARAGARAMHRLGVDRHQRRARGRLVYVQRIGRETWIDPHPQPLSQRERGAIRRCRERDGTCRRAAEWFPALNPCRWS